MSNNTLDISGKLAIDTKSVDNLRLQAKKNPDQALKGVAKQFEAIFVQMMLESMRKALPKDGLFDSQQSQFYTHMLDQQLAQNIAAKGIGLADILIRQMARSQTPPDKLKSTEDASFPVHTSSHQPMVAMPAGKNADISSLLWQINKTTAKTPKQVAPVNPQDRDFTAIQVLNSPVPSSAQKQADNFVSSLMLHAKKAAEATGIPAHFMIAQAALESGWGKHEILGINNKPSFNLFGIKAGQSWQGAVVKTVTTEYINGEPRKMTEKFRVYRSYAESFQDYANLLLSNPRYRDVLKNQDAEAFARGLQQAGYATDPSYADKLIRIINSHAIRKNQMI